MRQNRHTLMQDVDQAIRNSFAQIELTTTQLDYWLGICQQTPKGSLLYGEYVDVPGASTSGGNINITGAKYDFLDCYNPHDPDFPHYWWLHENGVYQITIEADIDAIGSSPLYLDSLGVIILPSNPLPISAGCRLWWRIPMPNSGDNTRCVSLSYYNPAGLALSNITIKIWYWLPM